MNKQPDISLIRKYLNGELDARAMYELERQAEHDPQLRDMLAGMEMAPPEEHAANLADIRQRLQARITAEKVPVRRIYFGRWAAAASVLLVLSIATLFLLRREPGPEPQTVSAPAAAPEVEEVTPEAAESEKPLLARALPEEVAEKGEPVAEHQEVPDPLRDPAPQTLNEVVVVGYGAQKKESVTGAVTAVSPQDTLSVNANNALAGRVSGIVIRGSNSRNNDTSQPQVLDEMVVSRKNTLKKAEPVNGWKAYRDYLREQAVTAGNKRAAVTVAFRVDTTGAPVQIRIVKSNADESTNQQAINLIQNGARWFAAADSVGNEVQLRIRFK